MRTTGSVHRLCFRLVLGLGILLGAPSIAHAQDARTVSEPRIPPSCAKLDARLAARAGTLAKADEGRPDTERIQRAIDGCAAGKAVELASLGAKHVFLTGPIHLKSGVTLLVDAGTALFASRDARDYDVTPGSCGVVKPERGQCQALISAEHAPGSGIMGEGAIDGRGGVPLKAQQFSFWDLAHDAKVKDQFQACPKLITARQSDDFTLYRITLRNAANAHVLVEQSNGFTAWGVRIKTPKTARNTDGINPQSSSNVTIAYSYIDSGDDNVAIKAGALGPVSNVSILHNHFYAGHGMSIGSDTQGGVSHVLVSDLSLDGTDHGLRIKSDRSRGGLVTGVVYENVCMRKVPDPIWFDTRYTNFLGDKIPVYRQISFRDVTSVSPGSVTVLGFDPNNRVQLSLDNVNLIDPARDARVEHAEIHVGPRRGDLLPSGSDVLLYDQGTVPGVPLDCSRRFVPFEDSTTAPAAAVAIPAADRTLYVAASGSGDYYSIQRAVDVAPATGAVISIGPGTYRERLVIDKPRITLKSPYADATKTVIVSGQSAGTTGNTLNSATVEVRGRDFRAENLTFFNDYNRTHQQQFSGSQALALLVTGDRAAFRNLRLIGDQDTLYVGSPDCSPPAQEPKSCTPSRQYFEGAFIEGNVDFIFGNSLAVFERSEIHSNAHSIGYLTAQGKVSPGEQSSFVFDHCRLTADPGVSHVWLGRPWRPRASVVFLNTEMGAQIEPAGFREWHPGETDYLPTTSYAEYQSTGPGAHPGSRDPHVTELSRQQAAHHGPKRVLAGKDNWDPTK